MVRRFLMSVIEETTIAGVDYILVSSDFDDESEEGEIEVLPLLSSSRKKAKSLHTRQLKMKKNLQQLVKYLLSFYQKTISNLIIN